jgi:hypothetical protein
MRKTMMVLLALLVGLSFLVTPVLSQTATNPGSGKAGTVNYSGSTMPSANAGGSQARNVTNQSAGQSGTASVGPSGQAPLGGGSSCMGGAGANDSGGTASGMGSC